MAWPCRLIEYTKESTGQSLEIGDMFYFNPPANFNPEDGHDDTGWWWPSHFAAEHKLCDYYKQHNAHRPPLLVYLPGKVLFCVDGACWNTEGDKVIYHGGWTVSGEAPNISVSPSIDVHGIYHGHLTNGVITDDCEGRKYDQSGRKI